jgi:hypothetical protein
MNTNEIIESNDTTLTEFFTGIASCDYYKGQCWRLYLDLDDMSISISQEASCNTWQQRDDGSLIEVYRVSGYCDIPADERYTDPDTQDLIDFGWGEFINEIETRIDEALAELEN